MTTEQITGLIRQLLPIFGTLLAAFGFSAASTSTWINLIGEISGPLVIAASAIWSVVAKTPAAIAASAQALPGVEVDPSGASPAVKAAVNAVKAAA